MEMIASSGDVKAEILFCVYVELWLVLKAAIYASNN